MSQNDDLGRRLKAEVEASVPEVFDEVLKGIEREKGKTAVIDFSSATKKKKFPAKTILSVAAAFAVLLIASYSWLLSPSKNTFDVEIDVNPGVLLEVDKSEKVTDVKTLNTDGEIVLDGMDLEGSKLDVAVNALMFSIIKHGYIDEMTNTVLVTVTDENQVGTKNVSDKIAEQVSSIFKESSLEGSILVQSASSDNEIKKLSESLSITYGKAALINHLVKSEKTNFSADLLSKLSINELNILMNEKNAADDVTVIGQASRKAYIGDEAAKAIARNSIGVYQSDIRHIQSSIDMDDGIIVYDVEIIVSGAVYEIEINALTGAVSDIEVDAISEKDDFSETTVIETTTHLKTKEEVKEIVLSHSGLSSSDCKYFEIELDFEGIAHYEVEFYVGSTQYEYKVNAENGEILSFSSEIENGEIGSTEIAHEPTNPVEAPSQNVSEAVSEPYSTEADLSSSIDKDRAIEIALSHAGLTKDMVSDLEIEFSYNSGVVYEVEFVYNAVEYEYEISLLGGEILDVEKDS
ncbi:MAG: PepSY domain-containing protein [Clostridia bacterium]|nr:PepSY domain-containing protein [Clostridia bacterium]